MKNFEEFKKAMQDEAFRKSFAEACEKVVAYNKEIKGFEALAKAAEVLGYKISAEDMNQLPEKMGELSDDDLDNVVGGGIIDDFWYNATQDLSKDIREILLKTVSKTIMNTTVDFIKKL